MLRRPARARFAAVISCPICQRPVESQAKSAPFCSERCRLLDLGNWLDERYVVPATDDADAAPTGAPEDDDAGAFDEGAPSIPRLRDRRPAH